MLSVFFFQAEDGIRDIGVTGVQTCALPIYGLELSYNKQKDWVSVPIPNEYLISVFDFDNNKLKENTYYISHKKTAFISNFNSDILITVTNDKGKTWNEIKLRSEEHTSELQSRQYLVCRL